MKKGNLKKKKRAKGVKKMLNNDYAMKNMQKQYFYEFLCKS
jgi:hypothetical protein